ncbi:hypothetical protein SODG_003460 [Sodalis praecaptivus]
MCFDGKVQLAVKPPLSVPFHRSHLQLQCHEGGRSLQGEPVLKIQNTALINNRLSFATPPHLPFLPGSRGSILSQERSEMSCRRCDNKVNLSILK